MSACRCSKGSIATFLFFSESFFFMKILAFFVKDKTITELKELFNYIQKLQG